MERTRSLFIAKLSDGLFHFIGAVYEKELHQLSIKGFKHYWEAEDVRIQFNYLKFES
jgi:hypothetical protein